MSRFRVVAAPPQPLGLAVLSFVGRDPALEDRIRKALLGWRIVASTDAPTTASRAELDALRRQAPGVPMGLAGYSAGCQWVRAVLALGGAPPEHVAAIDGAHGSIPLARWQVDTWKRAPDLIVTCTSMRYTERIPVGQHGRAASTWAVAEAIAGEPLEVGRPVERPGLYVERYASGDIDRAAHVRQLREVMPAMLARWRGVRASTAPEAPKGPEGAVGALQAGADAVARLAADAISKLGLGARIVEVARAEYAKRIREIRGPEHDPRIVAYLRDTRRGGSPRAGMPGREGEGTSTLGASPADEVAWCAAARSWVVRAALGPGDEPGHGYRAAVRELVEDARRLGTWRERDAEPEPGWAAVFRRAGGDPRFGGSGHVSTVEHVEREHVITLGGNEGDAWQRAHVSRTSPELVGWIAC